MISRIAASVWSSFELLVCDVTAKALQCLPVDLSDFVSQSTQLNAVITALLWSLLFATL